MDGQNGKVLCPRCSEMVDGPLVPSSSRGNLENVCTGCKVNEKQASKSNEPFGMFHPCAK